MSQEAPITEVVWSFEALMKDWGLPKLVAQLSEAKRTLMAARKERAVLVLSGSARAENECGRPEAGTPIVCSPSNYDASTDGNIVYFASLNAYAPPPTLSGMVVSYAIAQELCWCQQARTRDRLHRWQHRCQAD